MKARELNRAGIALARRFLAEVREDPAGQRCPPEELVDSTRYTRAFRGDLIVERPARPFATRREIGEYLAPRLRPFKSRIAERNSFWSWLGMLHFEDTVRRADGALRLSRQDETFVIDPLDSQSLRGGHRHYLRSAWQLYEVHGERAAFLLDQPPFDRRGIANQILQSRRIFNSQGIVVLILHLYTNRDRQKRGFHARPGGLPHLLRVLDQLERTHDVYGMTAEALLRILPPEFDRWANGGAPPKTTTRLLDASRGPHTPGEPDELGDLHASGETEDAPQGGPGTDAAGFMRNVGRRIRDLLKREE